MPYISKSSKYLKFISLRWKEPYYDKFQCHKLQEGYFSVQGRFCVNSNSEKSDPLFPFGRHSHAFGHSSMSRSLWTVPGCIHPDVMTTHPDAHQSSRRFQFFFADTDWEDSLDDMATQSGRQVLDKEITCRQFTTVRTPGQCCPDAVLDKAITSKQVATVRTLGQL
jgi:hypothetical protein